MKSTVVDESLSTNATTELCSREKLLHCFKRQHVTLMVIYVVCGQSKLKALVANIALQCIQGTESAGPQFQEVNCSCQTQWYIRGMLLLILLGMVILVTSKIKKSSLFGRHLFSNVTKVMLLISDMQLYVPLNLCKIAGSIHLFKI